MLTCGLLRGQNIENLKVQGDQIILQVSGPERQSVDWVPSLGDQHRFQSKARRLLILQVSGHLVAPPMLAVAIIELSRSCANTIFRSLLSLRNNSLTGAIPTGFSSFVASWFDRNCFFNTANLTLHRQLDCAPTESSVFQTLIGLYNSTLGERWTNCQNWLTGDPCINYWHGIGCVQPAGSSWSVVT